MKIVYFTHSLASDWNHGNAHFLRGVVGELLGRGHDVEVYEPSDSWSRINLLADQGADAVADVRRAFPWMRNTIYDAQAPDLPAMTEGVDLVIVHEWNPPDLVAALGRLRPDGGYRLLFHDTHHRAATAPEEMSRYDLSGYDGVLAFGKVISDIYTEQSWAKSAWTWHEAADTKVFYPRTARGRRADVVWIGNWGDGERSQELHQFLIDPIARLGLTATVHGVRYPAEARSALREAGIRFAGYRANHRVPVTFAAHAATVHVPRRPYVQALPGIPTIRPFEALACGVPLVSAPWEDAEGLFRPGQDYLVAHNGSEMQRLLDEVVHEPELAQSLAAHGLETISARHTCAHRVDELMKICANDLGLQT